MGKAIKFRGEPVYLTTNDEGGAYLSTCVDYSEGYTSRPATAEDLDAERIAEFLDQDAENGNCHNLVGVHAALLRALRKSLKHVQELDVEDLFFTDLLKAGGLLGLPQFI